MVLDDLILVAWTLAKIIAITLPLIICVAMYTLWERKVIGWMQVRMGPVHVGKGWLQPFADVIKLLIKEIIVPANANRFLFHLAPVLALAPAFAAWAVVPFDDGAVLADINAGLLYLLAMTSMGGQHEARLAVAVPGIDVRAPLQHLADGGQVALGDRALPRLCHRNIGADGVMRSRRPCGASRGPRGRNRAAVPAPRRCAAPPSARARPAPASSRA